MDDPCAFYPHISNAHNNDSIVGNLQSIHYHRMSESEFQIKNMIVLSALFCYASSEDVYANKYATMNKKYGGLQQTSALNILNVQTSISIKNISLNEGTPTGKAMHATLETPTSNSALSNQRGAEQDPRLKEINIITSFKPTTRVRDKTTNHINKSPTQQDLRKNSIRSKSLFKNNISKLRKRLENFRNQSDTRQGKDQLIEYPGGNKTARAEHLKRWTAYYTCLQEKIKFNPQVHYVFPGASIRFECDACLQPGGAGLGAVRWQRAAVATNHRQHDIIPATFSGSKRLLLSENGLKLSIYGVQTKDAGNYTCTMYDTLKSVHLLHVADEAQNITKVWPERVLREPHPAPPITLPAHGVTVFSKWTNWTACSRCGRAGKRIKNGVCTVSLASAQPASPGPMILFIFRAGLPCQSSLLPASIRLHPYVAQRNSEIMESFCKVPCPKRGNFTVRNEKGKVVEEADNDAGIYSMMQKLPALPPPVQRSIKFMNQWETAHLLCPGRLHDDAPVRWYRKKQPILSSDDRIRVSPSHLLIIEDIGQSDATLYSCWQTGRLVGSVRLQVSTPVRLSFSQQLSALSMVLIVATFLVVFSRVLCRFLRERYEEN